MPTKKIFVNDNMDQPMGHQPLAATQSPKVVAPVTPSTSVAPASADFGKGSGGSTAPEPSPYGDGK